MIPTRLGGTHVAGFRDGIYAAIKKFIDLHAMGQKGLKITPDDVFDACSYVLSVKMSEPQFSGQTKERLTSRECASFVSQHMKDACSLWLNQHVQNGEKIAQFVIEKAQSRLKSSKKFSIF